VEPEASLPCSGKSAAGFYPVPVESGSYHHTPFKIRFNVLLSTSSSKWLFPGFPSKISQFPCMLHESPISSLIDHPNNI